MKHFYIISTLFVFVCTTHAQGPLTPPGPPDTTMRTLDEVESRTPIESVPYTIDEPGSYYLTGNLDAGADGGITIEADNVTIDLMGFTLAGTDSVGILVSPQVENTVIRNGVIEGFETGVRLDGSRNGVYERLRISDMAGRGLELIASGAEVMVTGNVIHDCIIANNGSDGVQLRAQSDGIIEGNRIEQSVIVHNGDNGIYILASLGSYILNNQITGCTVTGNGTFEGTLGRYGVYMWSSAAMIRGTQIQDNSLLDNDGRGIYLRVSGGGQLQDTSIHDNVIHDHSNAGILANGVGLIRGARVQGNVISLTGPPSSGIRFSGDIAEDNKIEDIYIESNLLADNLNQNIVMNEVVRGVVQGNHVSGEAVQGILMDGIEGLIVTSNTAFGEPIITSSQDTYGQIVESEPIPNDAWANFQMDDD